MTVKLVAMSGWWLVGVSGKNGKDGWMVVVVVNLVIFGCRAGMDGEIEFGSRG